MSRPESRSQVFQREAHVRSAKLAGSPTKTSLQALLAKYIQTVDPILQRDASLKGPCDLANSLDEALSNLYTDGVVASLESRGYSVEDMMCWAWIITAHSAERAALRLMAVTNRNGLSNKPGHQVPIFLYLFLLRRPRLTVRSLKLLLLLGWDRLTGRKSRQGARSSPLDLDNALKPDSWSIKRWKNYDADVGTNMRMDEPTAMVMIVRLLRHARVLWPQAIVSIAAMISTHVDGVGSATRYSSTAGLSERSAARITFLYNRALSLLSIPSSLHPFHSSAYHQRAQFNLLRRMTEFEPALTINREGYRAITRVQLAHEKTVKERQWAMMKAKSWPPWKEEKLGLDVEKGIEDGISRASESLSRSREAGYSSLTWEKVAHIFAGWDTDRSPTIQTRTSLRKAPVVRGLRSSSAKEQDIASSDDRNKKIWASRIRSTRTVEEAWACFLANEDEKLPPSQDVYYAMFEKLVFKSKLRRQKPTTEMQSDHILTSEETQEVMPGDGKEVYLAPISPQEATYIRTQPPSLGDLFDRMIKDGILPAGRCLAFLVGHADSLGDGLRYLRSSRLSTRVITALTTPDVSVTRCYIADLRSLPDYMFAAVIRLLSRFASSAVPTLGQQYIETKDSGKTIRESQKGVAKEHRDRVSPLLHAFRLMNLRKPQYRPSWNSLLSALARSGVRITSSYQYRSPASSDVTAWKSMLEVVRQMSAAGLDLDSQGFQTLCIGLEKAIIASQQTIRKDCAAEAIPAMELDASVSGRVAEVKAKSQLTREAEEVLEGGPRFITVAFSRLIGMNHLPGDSNSGFEECARLVLGDGDQIEPSALLPRLLSVPGPSHLHAYVRVLGMVQDYEALLALLRWMVEFAPEVQAVADEARNGRRLLRRSLVAIRVFLERSWIFMSEDDDEDDYPLEPMDGAPEHVMQRVYEIIEGVEGWGGWPTDDEVAAYCRKGRLS